jgi:hypothetical protein
MEDGHIHAFRIRSRPRLSSPYPARPLSPGLKSFGYGDAANAHHVRPGTASPSRAVSESTAGSPGDTSTCALANT